MQVKISEINGVKRVTDKLMHIPISEVPIYDLNKPPKKIELLDEESSSYYELDFFTQSFIEGLPSWMYYNHKHNVTIHFTFSRPEDSTAVRTVFVFHHYDDYGQKAGSVTMAIKKDLDFMYQSFLADYVIHASPLKLQLDHTYKLSFGKLTPEESLQFTDKRKVTLWAFDLYETYNLMMSYLHEKD